MGVNFSAFEIGRRALRASQLGINITGQNIANVNTPGYTRLKVEVVPTVNNGGSIRLTSNEITQDGVRALRDQFVEARLETETGLTGRLTARRDALVPVDAAFNDSNLAGGLHSSLTSFFNSFRDLEANPTSVPLRAAVVAKADTLAAAFQTTSGRLGDIRDEADATVRNTTEQVNTLAKQVADFNVQIPLIENSGGSASELRDQRGEVVRQLAQLTGVRSIESSEGQVTLAFSDGRALVIGSEAHELQITDTPPHGLAQLSLNGQPVDFTSGELRGLSEALGEIQNQLDSLDDLAASVADRVNTLHASGSDLDGNNGTAFFTANGGGTVTASNLIVAAAIKANPRLVVAAANGAGSGDASIARGIAGLLNDKTSTIGSETTSFESFYSTLVTNAGDGVRAAEDALATQQLILQQTQAQRDAVSGVSLDEEAINLLQYQKSYEAAARFLKVADEMTQTILSLAQ